MAQTSEYRVTGMTCGHCESAVRGEVSKIAGVHSVTVDAQTGVLVIDADSALNDADVLAAVEEAGYEAVPA